MQYIHKYFALKNYSNRRRDESAIKICKTLH